MPPSKQIAQSPAKNIKALTPSDTVDFSPRPRGIIIGVAGDIVFVNDDNTTTTVSDGELTSTIILPLSPKRINATNTTATKLYGVY